MSSQTHISPAFNEKLIAIIVQATGQPVTEKSIGQFLYFQVRDRVQADSTDSIENQVRDGIADLIKHLTLVRNNIPRKG